MFTTDRFFAGVIAVLAALFLFAPARAATFTVYATPNAPEAAATVPENNAKTVIISLPIADVLKGDILVTTGEVELTNNGSQWAMFGRSMILATSPTATTGQAITEMNEENFNPTSGSCWIGRCDVHHLIGFKASIAVANSNLATGYINFLAWSATDPPQPSYTLTVQNGYGRVSVLKIRQ